MSKVLIVFYSRTGTTRRLAGAIRARCRADMEEIREARPRTGFFRGWLKSIWEVRRKREADILPGGPPLGDYDLIVLGTPVWAASMSSPLRTWLNRHRREIRKLAIFVTQGGRGGDQAVAQIAELCGLAPVARLVVNARDLGTGACEPELAAFVSRLRLADPAAAGPTAQ